MKKKNQSVPYLLLSPPAQCAIRLTAQDHSVAYVNLYSATLLKVTQEIKS